ncbi:hypothetical protein V8C35DRAFT_287117 [Trichoderma chlorosporum]
MHRNSYTTAWICALNTAQIAAEEFLDEEHPALDDIPLTDSNHYTLGSVGKHNVVIAVIPRDKHGTAFAANVVTDLLSSFPNVKLSLMIGIGGGAPSEKHDIRLGDVVVGAAGVFHYDLEETLRVRTFRYIGSLSTAPRVLRTAASTLQTQYKRRGHRLREAVDDILKNNKRLQKDFGRPDAASDILFRSNLIHNSRGCASVCAQDESNLIIRRERTEGEEDDPAVHYGLIASANQLMRDASIRDRLSAEREVLCFEMESEGLFKQLPCLVIRGICDYSDSHQDDEWQGYAAMTAAAYAKDLILQIHPSRVEAEQRLSDVLYEVLDPTLGINTNPQGTRSQLQSEEDCRILEWLSDFNYKSPHTDNTRRRQDGTGQWLLDSAKYQDWASKNRESLFCPGFPGAGKTFIVSSVIDDLQTRFLDDPTVGIAYYYFNFKRQGKQTADRVMASLLKQLCTYQTSLSGILESLYNKHQGSNTRPSLKELLTALRSVVNTYSKVYLVVDALDEWLQPSDRTLFISWVFYLQTKSDVNIFATSRPVLEVEELFEGFPSIEIAANQEDVCKYIDGHMSRLPAFVQHNAHLREQIKLDISSNVQGIFLLAQLYLGLLEDKVTPKEIRKALEKVRRQGQKQDKLQILDEAYDDTLNIIRCQRKGFRRLAKKALYWISHSKRELTTIELQHAIAVDRELDRENKENIPRDLDEESIPEIDLIVLTCCGFVTVDEEGKYIRLVHGTAQRYLNQMREKWFSEAEERISEACALYLSFETSQSGIGRRKFPLDWEFNKRRR